MIPFYGWKSAKQRFSSEKDPNHHCLGMCVDQLISARSGGNAGVAVYCEYGFICSVNLVYFYLCVRKLHNLRVGQLKTKKVWPILSTSLQCSLGTDILSQRSFINLSVSKLSCNGKTRRFK
jgi:hypothetical protein